MTFLHFRFRRLLGLLASSSLPPDEAARLRRHVASCPSCASELAALNSVNALLAADAAIDRPLPISSEALRTRVLARANETPAPAHAPLAWSYARSATALALVGVGLFAGLLATRGLAPRPERAAALPALEDGSATASNNEAFYERLERTRVRAHAARYLAEAQDVLVQMRSAADCPDSPKDSVPKDTVDVGQESRTSRTLLRRRAALVSGAGESLLAARGVMEEVEGLLQQVAELPQCTRRSDVAAIARNVERKNLLMKIDMVAQELAAP